MRILVGAVLVVVSALTLGRADEATLPTDAVARLRSQVNPEYVAWPAEQVFDRCAEHLATIKKEDRCRIRYFDLSGVPRQILPAMASSLMLGTNSAARSPVVYVPQAVPGTDNRIFWIDICWYNWTPEAWESLSLEEPYLREPIIPSNSRSLAFLKAETLANPVMRADWFLWYTFDNGEFINVKKATLFNPEAFYYKLLYANVEFDREVEEKVTQTTTERRTVQEQRGAYIYQVVKDVPVQKEVVQKVKKKVKGVGPDTAAEFEKAWLVDFDHLKEYPIDQGTTVDEGFSGVAYHNRVLWRVRTKIGVYWRTFDVFRTAGDQDFVENVFPKEFDAGEHIFQDERGAQFYHLTDGKGKSVDFANPFVVKGDPAGPHNTVLVTARSCIHCHDTGILKGKDVHLENMLAGVLLKGATVDRDERSRQFYLRHKKFDKLMGGDQANYADFVRDCNGLTPSENIQNFQRARSWYGAGVKLAQAARELGCEPKELQDALGYQTAKARLGRLAMEDYAIPRSVWERGGYAEAGLLLLEWRRKRTMNPPDTRFLKIETYPRKDSP